MSSITSFLVALLVLISDPINLVAAQSQCPDVSPCFCYGAGSFLPVSVTCDKVPLEDVKTVFSKVLPFEMRTFNLNLPSSPTVFIPANIIGFCKANEMIIQGDGILDPNYTVLEVDPKAFDGPGKNVLSTLRMSNLDHNRLNFNFLDGFGGIVILEIVKSTNIDKSIPTMPQLYALSSLYIKSSTGLRELFQSPINPVDSLNVSGLQLLEVSDSFLDTNSMGNLLDWILPSSWNSLAFLYFGTNVLESIPSQMSSFKSLEILDISNNKMDMTIENNSIFMNSTVNEGAYKIRNSRVICVDPGAFQGNYGSCIFNLEQNLLTRFEEASFKSILQDVYDFNEPNGGNGLIIDTNPFDCYSDSCHLAWLLRDNRHLLGSFRYAPPACADGTNFKDLSPSLFVNCP